MFINLEQAQLLIYYARLTGFLIRLIRRYRIVYETLCITKCDFRVCKNKLIRRRSFWLAHTLLADVIDIGGIGLDNDFIDFELLELLGVRISCRSFIGLK